MHGIHRQVFERHITLAHISILSVTSGFPVLPIHSNSFLLCTKVCQFVSLCLSTIQLIVPPGVCNLLILFLHPDPPSHIPLQLSRYSAFTKGASAAPTIFTILVDAFGVSKNLVTTHLTTLINANDDVVHDNSYTGNLNILLSSYPLRRVPVHQRPRLHAKHIIVSRLFPPFYADIPSSLLDCHVLFSFVLLAAHFPLSRNFFNKNICLCTVFVSFVSCFLSQPSHPTFFVCLFRSLVSPT